MRCDKCGKRIDRSRSRITQSCWNYCENCRNELDIEIAGQALIEGSTTQIDDAIEYYRAKITESWRTSVTAIIATGQALAEAKNNLPHGQWIPFVEEHLPFGGRTARMLIQLSESQNFDDSILLHAKPKRNHGSDLTADKTIKIAAPSDIDPGIPVEAEQTRTMSSHLDILPASWRTLHDLAVLPRDDFFNLISDGIIRPEMQRADIKAGLAVRRSPVLPVTAILTQCNGKYGAILADPPWQFKNRGSAPTDRSTEVHYPTLSMDDLSALPVVDLAADDCVLFLWVTSDHLMTAGDLMTAWGFQYKTTAFVWRKLGPIGLGYWTRKQVEICLLGTRGKPQRIAADVPEIIDATRGKHSEKPIATYSRIERLVKGPYIDLFARRRRKGWSTWGNDPNLKEE